MTSTQGQMSHVICTSIESLRTVSLVLRCSSHKNLGKSFHFLCLVYTSSYLFSCTNYTCRTCDIYPRADVTCHLYKNMVIRNRIVDVMMQFLQNLGKSFHCLCIMFSLTIYLVGSILVQRTCDITQGQISHVICTSIES